MPGEKIGDYEIIGTLGSGCWGTTYEATKIDKTDTSKSERDEEIDTLKSEQDEEKDKQKSVCLKSEQSLTKAREEAQAINDIYDLKDDKISRAFEHDGNYYFTMPIYKGPNLEKVFQKGLSLIGKIRVAQAIKKEMEKVFGKGYLHRDIKLDNIIYTPADKDGPIKLIDYGRAVKQDAKEKKYIDHWSIRLWWQPQTAPEFRYRKEDGSNIDTHSDIYSFGLILKRFFPDVPEQLDKLYAYNPSEEDESFRHRTRTFEELETKLGQIFATKRDELRARCKALIDETPDGPKKEQLKSLRATLKEANIDEPATITALYEPCNEAFNNFSDTSIHSLVVAIYEFLNYFGFYKEDALQLQVRQFFDPAADTIAPSSSPSMYSPPS